MAGGVTVTRCERLSGQLIRIFIRMRTSADKLWQGGRFRFPSRPGCAVCGDLHPPPHALHPNADNWEWLPTLAPCGTWSVTDTIKIPDFAFQLDLAFDVLSRYPTAEVLRNHVGKIEEHDSRPRDYPRNPMSRIRRELRSAHDVFGVHSNPRNTFALRYVPTYIHMYTI